MKIRLEWAGKTWEANLDKPLDLSIPLRSGSENPKAWWAPDPRFEPVKMGDFIGSVSKGGSVNFFNVFLNPHGNGTHTESLGHISSQQESINQHLKTYHCIAQVLSVTPNRLDRGDQVIPASTFADIEPNIEALIIRTLPNSGKLKKDYSGSNAPYYEPEGLAQLAKKGIKHLLVDLPSVDREEDDGKLAAHRAFWEYPDNPRLAATISELVYVPDEIADGVYLLNLQIPPFELDAAPSRPVLFHLQSV